MFWRMLPVVCALAMAPGAAGQNIIGARPGVLNHKEGRVLIDGKAPVAGAGRPIQIEAGQTLSTEDGKAEMLLTPGVFLRLGERSAVSMMTDSLTDARLAFEWGEALVEVAELYKGNRIVIVNAGVPVTLLKRGLYRFDGAAVRVFAGKAQAVKGHSTVTVKKGRQLALSGARLEIVKFDRRTGDPLYAWSRARSACVAEAGEASARSVAANGYSWTPGWHWSPFRSRHRP